MYWHLSHRCDDRARPLADRHYNRQSVGAKNFAPPARTLVLLTRDADALWITSFPYAEYVRHAWAGAYICSTFRNESPALSSTLIREAVAVTVGKWPEIPALGMVTFINPKKVRKKRDFGRCYRKAGFIKAACPRHQELVKGCMSCLGKTKEGLVALQLLPDQMPDPLIPLPFIGERPKKKRVSMSQGTTDSGGYDWQNGQGGDAEEKFDPNEYLLAPAVATKDADTIAAENAGRNFTEPGDYELVVVGFKAKPKLDNVQKHHNGRAISYTAAGVSVRFANAADRGQTILCWFRLPPDDPKSMQYYFEAGNASGGGQGFEANQLVYFLNRLGFDWGQGQPMPDDARRLGNWLGRHVVARIDWEKPKKDAQPQIDPSTNQPYPPQCKIVPFSFRSVEGGVTLQPHLPLGGLAPQVQQQPAQAQSPAPSPPQGQPPAPRPPAPQPASRPPTPSPARASLASL